MCAAAAVLSSSARLPVIMSGVEDVKVQEHIDADVAEESEKSMPSSQEEVVMVYWISLHATFTIEPILCAWKKKLFQGYA